MAPLHGVHRPIRRHVNPSRTAQDFDDTLLRLIRSAIEPGIVIETVTSQRPNRIVAIQSQGLLVETRRSEDRGSGPQLVPAWMINVAWDHLCRTGQLVQSELVNDMNVKRSAFVCALLRLFPGVVVRSTRPTVLELNRE